MADPAIELTGVVGHVEGTPVLHGVDLRAPAGRISVLLGPSGAGKTVTVKHILGLLEPASGSVRVLGHELTELAGTQVDAVRRSLAAVLEGATPQGCGLFASLSAADNVRYGLTARGRADVAKEYLARVGLADDHALFPEQMSAGMRKRLALARALALESPLLIMDDFEGGLDGPALTQLCDLVLAAQRERGVTVLLVTHDMTVARRLADHVTVIASGRTVVSGEAAVVFASDEALVAQLLSGATTGPLTMRSGAAAPAPARARTDGLSSWALAALVVVVVLAAAWLLTDLGADLQF